MDRLHDSIVIWFKLIVNCGLRIDFMYSRSVQVDSKLWIGFMYGRLVPFVPVPIHCFIFCQVLVVAYSLQVTLSLCSYVAH